MKITIVCSSKIHPVFTYLEKWTTINSNLHKIKLTTSISEITSGDILFLISVNELVSKEIREHFSHTLVIHGSNLPEGRGWSPISWQILEGKTKFTLTLFEAIDKIDAGPIWKKNNFELEGHELIDEINKHVFENELSLMDFAVNNVLSIVPIEQSFYDGPYYSKRTPQDSMIDPEKTIAEQFDLMRIADKDRYPNFFVIRGCYYKITLEKLDMKNTI